MKKNYPLFVFILAFAALKAQNPIPNSSFETWSSGKPSSWTNSSNITQTTDKYSGTYAAKGEQVSGQGAPQLSAGSGNGVAISHRYTYLNLYYKFNKVGNTTLKISAYFDDPNYTIGQVSRTISTGASTFTALSIPISYSLSGTPNSCTIDIFMNSPADGSYFIIDDVSLSSSPLGIDELDKDDAGLNVFPNPVSASISVFLANHQAIQYISFFDVMGQKMKEMIPNGTFSSIDVSDLPAGNYIVAVKADDRILTRKIQVTR